MKKLILGAALVTSATPALADGAFEKFARALGADMISVTRKEQDLYQIDYGNTFVKTRYCYEYSYGEDAFIYKDTLYFVESDEYCDVEGIYRKG